MKTSTAPKQAAAHTDDFRARHPGNAKSAPMDDLTDLSQFDGHTPGPWDANPNDREWDGSVRGASGVIVCVPEQHVDAADANTIIIAAAPALLAECRRQREEIKVLREALQLGLDTLVPARADCNPREKRFSDDARAALKVSP